MLSLLPLLLLFPPPCLSSPPLSPPLPSQPSDFLLSLPSYSEKLSDTGYSQAGQDGILQRLFSVLGVANGYFVEFGFNVPSYTYEGDDAVQGGNSGSNSRALYEAGWRGLLMDSTYSNPEINLHAHFVTAENIVSLFEMYGVPRDVDYVSIDIDSADLWVFEALTGPSSPYRPRVLTVEFNCAFPPPLAITCAADCRWSGDRLYGASAHALAAVGRRNGYTVAAVTPDTDVVFVRADLVAETTAVGAEALLAGLQACVIHEPVRDRGRIYDGTLLDYEVYRGATDVTDGGGGGEEAGRMAKAAAVTAAGDAIRGWGGEVAGQPTVEFILTASGEEVMRRIREAGGGVTGEGTGGRVSTREL